jgi:hypothetical protein
MPDTAPTPPATTADLRERAAEAEMHGQWASAAEFLYAAMAAYPRPLSAIGRLDYNALESRARAAEGLATAQAEQAGHRYTPPRKVRGPKPKPIEDLKQRSRVNVTMDPEAGQALAAFQEKLAARLGFMPTLTQTVTWLIKRAEPLLERED